MTQATRPDVHPLCDKHPVAYMERDTGDLYHCTAGSCTRHYDTIREEFGGNSGTGNSDGIRGQTGRSPSFFRLSGMRKPATSRLSPGFPSG